MSFRMGDFGVNGGFCKRKWVIWGLNDKRGIEKELSKTLKAMVKDGSAKKILQKYVPDAEKYLEVNSLER